MKLETREERIDQNLEKLKNKKGGFYKDLFWDFVVVKEEEE